jgi:hypothetical protein
MKVESVEIYSDASNMAVMKHPGRAFPGVLVQGDTLHSMVASLRYVIGNGDCLPEEAAGRLREVVEGMEDMLRHYRSVLIANQIPLPFRDYGKGETREALHCLSRGVGSRGMYDAAR